MTLKFASRPSPEWVAFRAFFGTAEAATTVDLVTDAEGNFAAFRSELGQGPGGVPTGAVLGREAVLHERVEGWQRGGSEAAEDRRGERPTAPTRVHEIQLVANEPLGRLSDLPRSAIRLAERLHCLPARAAAQADAAPFPTSLVLWLFEHLDDCLDRRGPVGVPDQRVECAVAALDDATAQIADQFLDRRRVLGCPRGNQQEECGGEADRRHRVILPAERGSGAASPPSCSEPERKSIVSGSSDS